MQHRVDAGHRFGQAGVRTQSGVTNRLDALAERAADLLFGSHSSNDELAGLALALDLKPVLRRLTHLPDEELRETLRRLCNRLLPS